ncbi:MAG TPA: hypothetical protein VI877_02825, partial [Dehalococcoidia bacterium]|nr:hypothetical protein [Dehalococcoidia bacterium]
ASEKEADHCWQPYAAGNDAAQQRSGYHYDEIQRKGIGQGLATSTEDEQDGRLYYNLRKGGVLLTFQL